MTNKWFRVIKIASAILSISSTALSMYVDSERIPREVSKEVLKAVAKMKQRES